MFRNDTKEFLKKSCFWFYVNCNDMFAYACADAEQVSIDDLDIFVKAYAKYGHDGVRALCSLYRNAEIIKPLQNAKYFKAKGEYASYKFSDI